ncbi:hypothetical protein HBI45_054800 [Parastagonospora nodorum]|nr:hypothetical protein HBI45_054800 [Parastagonospora nodorum]
MVFSSCFDSTPSSVHFTSSPASTDDVARANGRQIDSGVSRLLMLPKELRLEIWAYVLTDSSREKPVLHISRSFAGVSISGKRFGNSLYKHSKRPEIETRFHEQPKLSVGANLLRTNHLVYGEALPILYHSVIFSPRDLQGIFPLFIEKLSSFAKSHMRFIRLPVSRHHGRSSIYFYWALTCAQVAKLSGSLHLVELEGEDTIFTDTGFRRCAIINPLLKIKAPIKLLGRRDAEFQKVLANAAGEKEARAGVREARTITIVAGPEQMSEDRSRKRPYLQELPFREPQEGTSSRTADEQEAAHNLGALLGIEQSESDDLLEWDMLSMTSARSSLSLCHAGLRYENQSGPGGSNDGDDDGGWELIDNCS